MLIIREGLCFLFPSSLNRLTYSRTDITSAVFPCPIPRLCASALKERFPTPQESSSCFRSSLLPSCEFLKIIPQYQLRPSKLDTNGPASHAHSAYRHTKSLERPMKMEYSTPSPSDTSSNSSESTMATVWSPADLESPVTPPIPYATLSELTRLPVTSHPREMTASSGSNPPSPLPNTRRQGRGSDWVEPTDWAPHRETIRVLYLEENKTLTYIINLMELRYNFKATDRMYKQRLSHWGFFKNITEKRLEKLVEIVMEAEADGKTPEVDLGTMIKAMKYIKRSKPTNPRRAAIMKKRADIIRPYSVEAVKGRSGRAKAANPSLKLAKRQSPPSHPAMPWSPNVYMTEGVPDDMTQLLQTFVSEELHEMSYPYPGSSMPFTSTTIPASSPHWHSEGSSQGPSLGAQMCPSFEAASELEETMLDFTIRLRYANILLDDGLTDLAMQLVRECLNTLSHWFQRTHNTDTKATATVLLYALSAALEMAVNFEHLDVLHMLFQHIKLVCAGQHPTMAEIAGRMPQSDRSLQISMLKLARQMISRAWFGYPGSQNPGFGLYSAAVDISISHFTPERKLHDLYHLAISSNIPQTAYLTMWMDARMAAAVCDAPVAAQQQGIWNPTDEIASVFLSWKHPSQAKKILVALSYLAGRVRDHKLARNWEVAERMARETAWFVEMGWGPDDAVTRKFREEAEGMKSPGLEQIPPVPASLPPLQAGEPMSFAPLEMIHGLPESDHFMRPSVDTPAGSSAGWVHTPTTTAAATLPALWNAGNNGNSMGSGVDMYGSCF